MIADRSEVMEKEDVEIPNQLRPEKDEDLRVVPIDSLLPELRNRRLQWEAVRLIVQLLPAAHRDTLHALLSFLAQLASHAEDDHQPGNKMDAANLATVFAPNLLHKNKPNETAR
jgi:hypothetical protein